MFRSYQLLIPTLLIAVVALAVVSPALAVPQAKIVIEPRIVEAFAGQPFTVDVWIRDLSEDMIDFGFVISWDPTMMEYISSANHVSANGWSLAGPGEVVNLDDSEYLLVAEGPAFGEDASWTTITFRCLGEGSSPINVVDWLIENEFEEPFDVEILKAAVNQNSEATVGGVVSQINKLEIITPYLALAGLITVVSAVVVISRRGRV
jgi:hypothetical protein